MARKPKPQKLRGFGLTGSAGAQERMGFVGALPKEETLDGDDIAASVPGFEAPVLKYAPSEPLLRIANVGTLGAGIALHLVGVKSALVTTLGINLVDIIGRQLSPQYRARVQLGAWNKGVGR